jgi:hypothetical protein
MVNCMNHVHMVVDQWRRSSWWTMDRGVVISPEHGLEAALGHRSLP